METLEQESGRAQPDCVRPSNADRSKSRLSSALGKVVLGVCIADKKECNNRHCIFQPMCACARAQLQQAGKAESRIWLAVAICGVVLILVAFVRVFASG